MISPHEILLISFTSKAAEEMNQRISKRLNIQVESKTFHKLGLEIITKNRGKRYDVVEDYFLSQLINEYFNKHVINDKEQTQKIINFFGYCINIPKDWSEFGSLGESYDYYRTVDFETIKGKIESSKENNKKELKHLADSLKVNRQTLQGETVKSLEEVIIANFLFLNGINYKYEAGYPYESPDKYRKKYRPDFYLPDFDIYIEHFGITKDNRTPWLSKIEEKKYIADMRWKQGFHRQNNTVLIETYSYYNRGGRLLSELEKKLKEAHVEFKEVDFLKIYKQIFFQQDNKYLTEFKKLISSFINLYKSNGYDVQTFDNIRKQALGTNNLFLRDRSLMFLDIIKPIFQLYQDNLQESEKIDFNDMINISRSKEPVKRETTTHIATAPNQVWTWDITWLNAFVKGQYYKLYLIIDIFSRLIVGYEVWETENAEYSKHLVRRATLAQGIAGSPLVLHSDNGSPMKAATFLATLEKLGVQSSFSRARVSNDNPYSEALFKTLKYRPRFPFKGFASLDEARKWVDKFVKWYNNSAEFQLEVFGEKWNAKYPQIYRSWQANWLDLIEYFQYPEELRRLIYTTNAVEGFHRMLRKHTKNKTSFPTDASLRKSIYLSVQEITKKWSMPIRYWGTILGQISIFFENELNSGESA